MRFHKVFDHIVAYNQQRNEAINNDLIFSNLSFFLGKTSFDDLYKLPHRSKITQMVVDVMGLKIDEIMGYNGLATKKLIIHKLLEVFCLSTLREFLTLFWEGRPQTSD